MLERIITIGEICILRRNHGKSRQKRQDIVLVYKDAILNVEEIPMQEFVEGAERNRDIKYFSCYNIQQQRECFCEIKDAVFQENRAEGRKPENR